MFESAELGHAVDAEHYAAEVEKLRTDLVEAQYQLLEEKTFPVIILVNGVDGAGKGETVNAGRAILAGMRARLGASNHAAKKANGSTARTPVVSMLRTVDTAGILKNLPFEERLSKAKYATKVIKQQELLGRLSRSSVMNKHAVIAVFEGMDAAGKGGTIRRITQALDARQYTVVPIAAPTDEERAQPYLWRFWRNVPRRGRFAIFDRSWYGRVLVERIEGFASEAAWSRAYSEINEFEKQLVDGGILVVKFWLAITKDEQIRRFKEREATKRKQFKITAEDWRNREKWDDYLVAATDMIDRTSTPYAPWTLLEANDKHLVRVRAIETILARLHSARGGK
jgi:polyphosphate kinase 2 (PPK2 family)